MAERLANAAFAAIHPPPSSAMETHISQALGSLNPSPEAVRGAPRDPQGHDSATTIPSPISGPIRASGDVSSELKCRMFVRAFCEDGAVLPPIARVLEMTPMQTPSSIHNSRV